MERYATLLLCLALGACASPRATSTAPGDAATSDVVDVLHSLFEAMRTKDRAALERLMAHNAQLVAVVDGERHTSSKDAFVEAVTSSNEELVERFWHPEVRIHGDIATVWTAYDFHRDETFSHCGHDAFQLARTDGAWQIVHVLYTRETDGCPASPLGPP